MLAVGLALSMASAPAAAAPAAGTLLRTVNVPSAAQCGSGISTSVAIVPGVLIDRVDIPILVVTSCFASVAGDPASANLYFLDPRTNPATLVTTKTTAPTPQLGWGALALRSNKGDLIGCGNSGAPGNVHAVYSIRIQGSNAAAPATLLFNARPGNDICNGLTWDTATRTIYQSPDVSDTIYHYSEAGTLLGSFASPPGCPNSGLAVGGGSLYAACNGELRIYQLNKTSGATVTQFSSAGTRTEDIECDPVSFASQGADAMWSKDAFTNQLFAFAIPTGTCGFAGSSPVIPAACPDGSTTDTDGDGLLDCWEQNGIDFDGDGVVDFQLCGAFISSATGATTQQCADPNHKDLFVEIDYMQFHRPDPAALFQVVQAFASAPVTNPDGTGGVRLHIQVDEQLTDLAGNPLEAPFLAFEPCTGPAGAGTPDFDQLKTRFFGTTADRANPKRLNAKRLVYRYSIWAHELLGLNSSGCSEVGGNDFVVSLGRFNAVNGHNVGNTDQQAGTFMHELGHTLGLRHGGDDRNNCKPNYLSVMTYSRQFIASTLGTLDYSDSVLPPLNQLSLNESSGIGAVAPTVIPSLAGSPVLVTANPAVDWNQNGVANDVNVNRTVNAFLNNGCDGNAGVTLTGFDDWAHLQYGFRSSIDFADGAHLTVFDAPEVSQKQALVAPDDNGNGIPDSMDNCPLSGGICNPIRVSGAGFNFPQTPTYRASFSMNVTGGTDPVGGSLSYNYTRTRMNFVATSITAVTVTGNTATITGNGTVNGAGGYNFTATVVSGSPDQFGIVIRNGSTPFYSATTAATSGGDLNITF